LQFLLVELYFFEASFGSRSFLDEVLLNIHELLLLSPECLVDILLDYSVDVLQITFHILNLGEESVTILFAKQILSRQITYFFPQLFLVRMLLAKLEFESSDFVLQLLLTVHPVQIIITLTI
jgi:hypothetical protein